MIPTLILIAIIIELTTRSILLSNLEKTKEKTEVQLPDFTYLTFEEATIKAKDLNLKIEIIEEYNDKIEKGQIIRQEPEYKPNYKIHSGNTIKVVISKGTKE